MKRIAGSILAVGALAFGACATMGNLFTRELVIEADGPWIARVGARSTQTIKGTGKRKVPAELRTGYCWSVIRPWLKLCSGSGLSTSSGISSSTGTSTSARTSANSTRTFGPSSKNRPRPSDIGRLLARKGPHAGSEGRP